MCLVFKRYPTFLHCCPSPTRRLFCRRHLESGIKALWFIDLRLATTVAHTMYPKKYAHGFFALCFVVVMQSFIMNSHEVFIHIHQGCFAGTGAIVRLPQCQWSKPDEYGKISQCITTTKHSKAKTVCIFLGIYCTILGAYRNCVYITDACEVHVVWYCVIVRFIVEIVNYFVKHLFWINNTLIRDNFTYFICS